jgi:D-alanyl-lipoteichoic acid acyltransferase DltB (MBOAT superfamily)
VLFNSYFFLFAFLPTALVSFHLLRRESWPRALAAVSILSLVFYASWDPRYLALLVPSLLVNYWLGETLARTRNRLWLWVGVTANLAVIGWFKYSLFFYVNLTGGADAPEFLRDIALPLGISFITFQKIRLFCVVLSAVDCRTNCAVSQPRSAGWARPEIGDALSLDDVFRADALCDRAVQESVVRRRTWLLRGHDFRLRVGGADGAAG